MQSSLQSKKARINIQLPAELKEKLSKLSAFEGKNVSTLVRESIEQKLAQIDKQIFEEKLSSLRPTPCAVNPIPYPIP